MTITIIHGILLNIDEHIFHKKRGINKIELWNALFDMALFIAPIFIALFTKFSYWWEKVFIAFCMASCLSIAKNELFYKGLDVKERLVHSLLYVLHPVILYAYYISWQTNYFDHHYYVWLTQLAFMLLGIQSITYRIIYWNYIRA